MNRFQQLALRTVLAASAFAGFAGAAAAHEGRHDDRRRPGVHHQVDRQVDHRQDRQMHRIRHGASTGRLTPHETRQLVQQQARIRQAEAQAWADGRVTRRERERLDALQDQAQRHISRQLRDRQMS